VKAIDLFFLSSLFVLLTSCNHQKPAPVAPPQPMNDTWEVSTPEQQGFDTLLLKQILQDIPSENPKLDGLVIVRNGRLVAEQYFNGYAADSLHNIWSITKAVTGTLIGMAVDSGLLSIEDSIVAYLEAYAPVDDPRKSSITIEHLLTMTSGLRWTELGGPKSEGFQLAFSEDWIRFILARPMDYAPGEKYNYSTGNTLLLAPILKEATGLQARDFAAQRLFGPMGITQFQWDRQSEFWTKTQSGELPGAELPGKISFRQPFADLTNTGSGLHMRLRDLGKIGQLYLQKGKWETQQLVDEAWIDASIAPHFSNKSYGYHWRMMNLEGQPCFFATGFGMQRIFVFPKIELVVGTTQHHYTTMPRGRELTLKMVRRIIRTIRE